MNWDLLGEHESAYDESGCEKINELTDIFDIVFDYINRGWVLDVCVDVFPCTEEPASEIPRCIQKYYDMYVDESYQKEMKSLFDVTFSTEEVIEESLIDALKSIFDLPTEKSWTGSVEQHKRNIEKVAEKLIEETG